MLKTNQKQDVKERQKGFIAFGERTPIKGCCMCHNRQLNRSISDGNELSTEAELLQLVNRVSSGLKLTGRLLRH